jgi:hypothetical protein
MNETPFKVLTSPKVTSLAVSPPSPTESTDRCPLTSPEPYDIHFSSIIMISRRFTRFVSLM